MVIRVQYFPVYVSGFAQVLKCKIYGKVVRKRHKELDHLGHILYKRLNLQKTI